MIERRAHIACEYTFEASHQLLRPDWPAERNERVFGRCVRLHGHSYRLVIGLYGPLDAETGMVVNFSELDAVVEERILDALDHRNLNEVVGGITTAENLVLNLRFDNGTVGSHTHTWAYESWIGEIELVSPNLRPPAQNDPVHYQRCVR